jgi:hypothetical protein
MNKIVTYNDFLKNRENIRKFIDNIIDEIPSITIYFPKNLTADDRHLIYTNSKGYLFEKLTNLSSKYSIKLWKECEAAKEDKLEILENRVNELSENVEECLCTLNVLSNKVNNLNNWLNFLVILNGTGWLYLYFSDPVRLVVDYNETLKFINQYNFDTLTF